MTERIDLEALRARIEKATGADCSFYDGIANDATLCIKAEHLQKAVGVLMAQFDCAHLTAITAQQRENKKEDIEVMYHFWKGSGISLLMSIPVETPQLASITSEIPGADFYEREIAEMFGVKFSGREETPPLLLPDDWDQGPPFLREEVEDE